MERIAVISDVHGNMVALDAVLAALPTGAVDGLVALGDMVQGGPQPAEVVAALRRLACPVVMGNADDWLLTGDFKGDNPAPPAEEEKLADIRRWSLAQLDEADRAFIAAFLPTVELELAFGRRLLCFHGSPTSFHHLIFPDTAEEEFQGYLGGYAEAFLCGGHTHRQQIRRVGDTFFFNPGSVGLAYSHAQSQDDFRLDPWAEYAILTSSRDGVALTFHRVAIDVPALRQVFATSGRPHAAEDAARWR
jgi:putative phosphoesterase